MKKIKSIRRRTGEVVHFEIERIARAIFKAFEAANEGGEVEAHTVAGNVFKNLLDLQTKLESTNKGAKFLPTVEMVQDLVEKEL